MMPRFTFSRTYPLARRIQDRSNHQANLQKQFLVLLWAGLPFQDRICNRKPYIDTLSFPHHISKHYAIIKSLLFKCKCLFSIGIQLFYKKYGITRF